ncbi:hypothetical protein N5S93_02660 [Aliarcobacter cryaerophilus]|uniref:hypothetical protein n=1 Tax=Aliarcobacter cryaerophilus TaxID=28198 RepID=UPI0021B20467|nr:hypothetical protein [Aliarcobacter cryaerophilus]MCT7494497.1 hypothetical protein [Aliarcobacter cryaerophilus]
MLGLIALILTISLNGCKDDESPVNIVAQKEMINHFFLGNRMFLKVDVTSKKDDVVLNNIIVNKGNCEMIKIGGDLFPRNLKYGESIGYLFSANCNVLQIEAVTNNGNWIINY